ncbi:EpsG family protein, partial [Candidatus Symbiothrix dinenymphae]|uniref:EpsG family protein n=1 Tax=Candidatus Symbiothrix dinenymphae TaxID=467085 RepID=UPI0013960528
MVLFLSQKKQARHELNIRIACITAFLFFFGLRGYIFTDWVVYSRIFEKTPSIWSSNVFDFFIGGDFASIEPGYKVYCVLLKSFFSDFFCFQFVSVAIDVFFLDYFFRRYSKNYALSFVLFILFGGLVLELNLMRNIKAILLFLYSIKYIEKKNFKAYLLCNVVGMSFHFSSILFLPMYFLLNRNLSKTFIWITFIIGNVLYLLQIKYIGAIVFYIASMVGGKYAFAVSYLDSEIYGASYGITIGYI